MSVINNRRWAGVAAITAIVGIGGFARAQINSLDTFRVQGFTQSDAVTTSSNGTFFASQIGIDSNSDFDGGTLVYPGPGSPGAFSPDSPQDLTLTFETPTLPDKATLDADFPTGTYTATATNSSTNASQTTSLDYTGDAFAHNVPAVNAASFTALQGMNPSQSLTVNFNGMIPDSAVNEADVFFTVHDASFNTLFDAGFLPASATSTTIPANALAPNTSYTFNLIFSDRINSTNQADGIFDTLGFDLSTTGAFTTGDVPEPASLTLLLMGGMVGISRRGSRHRVI